MTDQDASPTSADGEFDAALESCFDELAAEFDVEDFGTELSAQLARSRGRWAGFSRRLREAAIPRERTVELPVDPRPVQDPNSVRSTTRR